MTTKTLSEEIYRPIYAGKVIDARDVKEKVQEAKKELKEELCDSKQFGLPEDCQTVGCSCRVIERVFKDKFGKKLAGEENES